MAAEQGEELVLKARAKLDEGDLNAAIELFAYVLEEKVAKYHDKHIECAPAWVEYGRALLRKAQQADDPFGSKLPCEGGAQDAAKPAVAMDGADEKEVEIEDDDEKEPSADQEAAATTAEGGDDGADAEGEEEEAGEEADDLELAFQSLEMARLIYEQFPDKELELADVLEYLGEVNMENEMWHEAVTELEKSLELKQRHLPPDHRQLAHLHYQIATATVSLIESKRQQVKHHFESAAGVLRERLHAAGSRAGDSSASAGEESELRELLAEIEERVAEHSQQNNLPLTVPKPGDTVPSQPSGDTTIGFGSLALPEKAADGSVTTIGFGSQGAPTTRVLDLGVMGRSAGRKKAVLEPIPNPSNNSPQDIQPTVSKKARVE